MKMKFHNLISGQRGVCKLHNDKIVKSSIKITENGNNMNCIGGTIYDFLKIEVSPDMPFIYLQDICGKGDHGMCTCNSECEHFGKAIVFTEED